MWISRKLYNEMQDKVEKYRLKELQEAILPLTSSFFSRQVAVKQCFSENEKLKLINSQLEKEIKQMKPLIPLIPRKDLLKSKDIEELREIAEKIGVSQEEIINDSKSDLISDILFEEDRLSKI